MADRLENRMEVTNTSTGVPELANIIYRTGEFRSRDIGAAPTLPAGTLIARAGGGGGETSGRLMVFDTAQGISGLDVPIGVLSYAIVAPTEDTNFGIQYIASGMVRLEELATFNAIDFPLSETTLDQLRSVGIIPLGTEELWELDNQ